MPRGVGARVCDEMGVPLSDTARQGKWISNSLVCSYLEALLPMRALRALAGWAIEKSDFYLPRAELNPSESLSRRIFPWLEKTEQELQGKVEIAGNCVLKLMKELRIVVLQDAAELLIKVIFLLLFLLSINFRH